MEKCKFCEAELEEGVTLCPSCGKNNAEEVPAEEPVAEETVTTENAAEEAVSEEAAEETAEEVSEQAPTAEIKEGIQATPGKIALAIVGILVLVAIIVALLFGGMAGKDKAEVAADPTAAATEETVPPTIPEDTGRNDETCKGSYSVSDEEAIAGAATVVATMGDAKLTNAQLQMYYWSYISSFLGSENGYQMMMYGLMNMSQPLDTQVSLMDQGLTWQQYFLKCAIQNWQSIQAMALEAEANGYGITPEIQSLLDSMPAEMEAMAAQNGAESVEALLKQNMGAGVTMEDFINYQKVYYQGAPYYSAVTSGFTATDEEIEAFFAEHEQEYEDAGLTKEDKMVDVRHCLIMPEGATSETIRTETFSEEAWAASEKKAQDLLDGWLKGDKTEESFAALANENTDDSNDANMDGQPDGGLYTGVTKGQMVAEFENWCFDPSRQVGDTGIVKTTYGFHIMYYVGDQVTWPLYAEQDILAMKENEFLLNAMENHPLEVNYSAIQIANVTLQ